MILRVPTALEADAPAAPALRGRSDSAPPAGVSCGGKRRDGYDFPLEVGVLPENEHRVGCIRGILWALGFQAIAVILAILVFKLLR